MARIVLVSLAIAVLLGVAFVGCLRRDEHVAIGGEITWDDWGYRVTNVQELTELEGGVMKPKGVFKLVTLEVLNHARRVEYDMSWHQAVLTDAHGTRYEALADGNRLFANRGPSKIPPGGAAYSQLLFDTPRDAALELSIVWGGDFVQKFDALTSGERTIALR